MDTSHVQRQKQKELWGSAAAAWERWDEWLDRSTHGISERMCDLAELKAGGQVLDLACGAGQPMSTLAARVGPTGKVIATDLSPEMVVVARRKAARQGLEQVEVRVMDPERMDLDAASFDAVTCRLGLMLCPDPAGAVSEIRRVLRPGGRYAVAVWDEPAKNPYFTLLQQVLAEFVPPTAPENGPGPFRLSAPGALQSALHTGGLEDMKVESVEAAMTFESVDEYWDVQSELSPALKAAVKTLAEPELAKLRAAVTAALAARIVDGKVRLDATVLIASGTR